MSPARRPTDPAARILAVLGDVVGMAEAEITRLRKAKRDPKNIDNAMKLATQLHPLLGQLRRHEEFMAAAGDRVTFASALAFVRKLSADKREEFIAECGGEDDERRTDRGNVLGR